MMKTEKIRIENKSRGTVLVFKHCSTRSNEWNITTTYHICEKNVKTKSVLAIVGIQGFGPVYYWSSENRNQPDIWIAHDLIEVRKESSGLSVSFFVRFY